jgi:hypothetical protein
MSAELKNYLIVQDKIQEFLRQARQDRELNAARNQNQVARVFKFKLPGFFSFYRKPA